MSGSTNHEKNEFSSDASEEVIHQSEKKEETLFEPEDPVTAEKELDNDEVDSLEKDAESTHERVVLKRTASNWTQATGTSVATEASERSEALKKRKWTARLNPLKSKYIPPIPKERAVSREHKAGFFSLMYFQWINPLMTVGYQRPLEVNDIWSVNPDRSVYVMAEKLDANFAKRKAANSKRALLLALFDTFRFEMVFGGIMALIAAILQVLSPFTVKYLIAFAGQAYNAAHGNAATPNIGDGIGLVFGITAMQMIQSMTTNHFIYRGMMVGGQCRAVLIALIFDKAMKISGRAKAGEGTSPADNKAKPGSEEERSFFEKLLRKNKKAAEKNHEGWSNGRIVNLMSTDTYRVDQASGMFHVTWTSMFQVLLTLALLIVNLGYSALSGFALIVILIPLLTRAVRSLMTRRRYINKITDQRVTLTQEILSAVRFVKYFGWEMSFLDRLDKIRAQEIAKIAFLLSIRNGLLAVGLSIPIFASMLAFITLSQSNHDLEPAPVFSSLALFNSLRIPLNLLPTVIGQVVDGNASINRIQEFLNAEEVTEDATWDQDAKNAITVEHADFTWERTPTQNAEVVNTSGPNSGALKKGPPEKKKKKSAKEVKLATSSDDDSTKEEEIPFAIKDINLSLGRNELIAVIGTVGSGKSSLLGALAGDMRKTGGSITFSSGRAFCPQYAWIQNATLKENVIFGQRFDKRWYNQVIDACALRPDLEMLPNGDMTEIGERGITVSGGQKQRLNIARAIYFNADIVLMDDPLSAVDAHVGRHIMDNAICGLLKDKARVLATHQLHVLHRVDRIVWMKEGHIHKVSTFNEMMSNDEEFQKLMETTTVEEEKDNEKAEESEDEEKKKVDKQKKKKKKGPGLMQAEERATNAAGWTLYSAYVRSAGTILILPLVFLLLIIAQGANIVTSLWLSWWTTNEFGYTTGKYIGVYAALGAAQALLLFTFAVTLTVFCTKAGRVMLHKAITRVLRAPMSFFDTTPLGRITNRFGKDVDTMDNVLPESIRMFLFTMAMIVSVFILIIAYYYYFAIALAPLAVMFLFSANYYRASARELKRHESVLRSDVYSRFSEAISGTATIRAYGLQSQFATSVRDAIDSMDGAYFLTYANQRWLSTRLDVIGNMLVFVVGILVVTSRVQQNPATGGLVLSYILTIVQMIQFTVRQLAEVENNMNATERIHYYGTELEQEAPLKLGEVRPTWPEKGEIDFDNVQCDTEMDCH
ncbi:hypothetical protein MRB53_042056 [Persea americana]|nr:hypothetical protein MRB53_042056 [Persea americana]